MIQGHNRAVTRVKRAWVMAGIILLAGKLALAAGGEVHIDDHSFTFEGPFGKFDSQQLQRGLQVYQEVCAACHGLQFVPFRTLGDSDGLGLSATAVKAFAAKYEIFDPELDDYRPAKPVDHFPANNSVNAPDLSLMTKARAGFHGPFGTGLTQLFRGIGGPEYTATLLTAYTGKEKEEANTLLYANKAYPGGWIAMAPPLEDGQVEFADGADNSVEAMAVDVAAFLTWAAEPKMMARKQMGFVAVTLLTVLSVLLYFTNKRVWASVKGKREIQE